MKLISMTDFVLEVEKNSYTQTEKYNIIEWQTKCESFDKIVNYANFLKQPLKLEMFVPCDEDGEILHPEFVGGKEVIYDSSVQDAMMDKVIEYQQAKEKVLFEGFKFKKTSTYCIIYKNDNAVWASWDNRKTIEELIHFDLTLTENAIKKLGFS